METELLTAFRSLLTARLEELQSHADAAVAELVCHNFTEIEYIDRAAAEIDQTLKLRIKSRESRLINKIREALNRIENKTYGICESCGEDISIQRLKARPITTKCITCKEEEELQESAAVQTITTPGRVSL